MAGSAELQSLATSKAVAKLGCQALSRSMGDCQNYGPFVDPYYNTGPNTGPTLGDPKRDHNFDNPPYIYYLPGLERDRAMRGPFGPDRPLAQKLNFALRHWDKAVTGPGGTRLQSQNCLVIFIQIVLRAPSPHAQWRDMQILRTFGLSGFGLAGSSFGSWMSSVWVALGWARLHTNASADQCLDLEPDS